MKRLFSSLLAASAVSAFKDTSPFFYLSTSPLPERFSGSTIAAASAVSDKLLNEAVKCHSTTYIMAHQPGVAMSDFEAPGTARYLKKAVVNGTDVLKEHHAIPEVYGMIDMTAIMDVLVRKCGADMANVDMNTGEIPSPLAGTNVMFITFDELPAVSDPTARHHKMSEHDSFLHAIMSTIPSDHAYTLIYYTSPPDYSSTPRHGSNANHPAHYEFKRDINYSAAASADSQSSLFVRYTFLSPGLLMGAFVIVPILAILYVALSAISSIQVSYFAFSKEMGNFAQKKVQ